MTEGTEAWRSFKQMMVVMMVVMMMMIVKMERNCSRYVPYVMSLEEFKISKIEKSNVLVILRVHHLGDICLFRTYVLVQY